MFTACENKGFSMIFDNGFEISVQWGTMNYCSRKNDGDWDESTKDTRWKSSTAEIAIFNNNVTDEDALSGKDMIEFANDTVKGWVSTNDVANIIFIVSLSSSFKDLQQVVNTNNW
jgi:hypothetical protein